MFSLNINAEIYRRERCSTLEIDLMYFMMSYTLKTCSRRNIFSIKCALIYKISQQKTGFLKLVNNNNLIQQCDNNHLQTCKQLNTQLAQFKPQFLNIRTFNVYKSCNQMWETCSVLRCSKCLAFLLILHWKAYMFTNICRIIG